MHIFFPSCEILNFALVSLSLYKSYYSNFDWLKEEIGRKNILN